MKSPDVILFEYPGALIGGHPERGRSYAQPGLHQALRELVKQSRLVVLAPEHQPDAVQADLQRLALAEFFDEVISPPSTVRDRVANALYQIEVPVEQAVLVCSPPGWQALQPAPFGLRPVFYTGRVGLFEGVRANLRPSAAPIFSHYAQLPTLLSRLWSGTLSEGQALPVAARLGGLLLGFALGTAIMISLWQRDVQEMESRGEIVDDH